MFCDLKKTTCRNGQYRFQKNNQITVIIVVINNYKKLIFVVNDDEVNPHLRVPVDVGIVAEWRLVIIRWLKTRIWFDNNDYVHILF